jgi:hypothetical protein
MQQSEYNRLWRKAIAWEKEYIIIKKCLENLIIESTKNGISPQKMQEILTDHGLSNIHDKAFKGSEKELIYQQMK